MKTIVIALYDIHKEILFSAQHMPSSMRDLFLDILNLIQKNTISYLDKVASV